MAVKQRVEQGIKFCRILRDCPHNTELVGRGEKRGLIYDFEIRVDGALAGYWLKDGIRRGYDLADAARERVLLDNRRSWEGRSVTVESQAEFGSGFEAWRYLIPDSRAIAKRNAEREAKRLQQEQEQAASRRLRRIQEAAPKLLESLRLCAEWVSQHYVGSSAPACLREAEALLSAIEQQKEGSRESAQAEVPTL